MLSKLSNKVIDMDDIVSLIVVMLTVAVHGYYLGNKVGKLEGIVQGVKEMTIEIAVNMNSMTNRIAQLEREVLVIKEEKR